MGTQRAFTGTPDRKRSSPGNTNGAAPFAFGVSAGRSICRKGVGPKRSNSPSTGLIRASMSLRDKGCSSRWISSAFVFAGKSAWTSALRSRRA